jgi:hypothetical protein
MNNSIEHRKVDNKREARDFNQAFIDDGEEEAELRLPQNANIDDGFKFDFNTIGGGKKNDKSAVQGRRKKVQSSSEEEEEEAPVNSK